MPAMLIGIAVRVLLVPPPRGANDLFELGKLRFPTEFLERAISGSDEPRRIASAARFFDERNFLFRNFLAHVDHLPHRITCAVAKIVKTLLAGFQRENMR